MLDDAFRGLDAVTVSRQLSALLRLVCVGFNE